MWLPFSRIIASKQFSKFFRTLLIISCIILIVAPAILLLSWVTLLTWVLNTLSLTYPQTKKSGSVTSGDLAASFPGHAFLSSFLQKFTKRSGASWLRCVLEHYLAEMMHLQGSFHIRFSRKCPIIHNNLLFSVFNCQSNIGLARLQSEWRTVLLFFHYVFHSAVSIIDFLFLKSEYSECSQSPIHERNTHQKNNTA